MNSLQEQFNLNGLRNKVNIVGSTVAQGRSTVMFRHAIYLSEKGLKVLWIDGEYTVASLMKRAANVTPMVPSIMFGTVESPKDMVSVVSSIERKCGVDCEFDAIFVDVPFKHPRELFSELSWLCRVHNAQIWMTIQCKNENSTQESVRNSYSTVRDMFDKDAIGSLWTVSRSRKPNRFLVYTGTMAAAEDVGLDNIDGFTYDPATKLIKLPQTEITVEAMAKINEYITSHTNGKTK